MYNRPSTQNYTAECHRLKRTRWTGLRIVRWSRQRRPGSAQALRSITCIAHLYAEVA